MAYNKESVDRAIRAANRENGRPTNVAEARQIHRLLQGRHSARLEPGEPAGAPEGAPGGEAAAMPRQRFLISLAKLGHNASNAHEILGVGRSTIYRMANGKSEVPDVVKRLLDMYERYGIPAEHRTS